MKIDFINCTLSDIASPEKGSIISGPFGSNISSKFFQASGVPVIRGNNLSINGSKKFIDNGFVFVSKEKANELKAYAIRGDLIFTAAGTIGQVGIIENKSNYEQYVISNKQLRVRLDTKKVNPLYAYYWFSSPWMFKQIVNKNTGSTVPLINLGIIKKLEIKLPKKRETQDKIVAILSALDAKFDLNQRINTELESMAMMLFDYWFVQFEFPNDAGKPYKSNGGKMVWNDELKREIPEGWQAGNLLDIADYANGLPCQKYRPTGKDVLKVIKIKEMHGGFSPETEFVRADIPPYAKIENGDVLFSWSASLEVQIWSKGKGALNQHIFKVTSNNYPKYYYYYQLLNYLDHFKMMAENRKTTMGHITQEHLKQSRIVLPPKMLTLELEKTIKPLLDLKNNNEIENQELSDLRGWLLPMLMNGQISVEQADITHEKIFSKPSSENYELPVGKLSSGSI